MKIFLLLVACLVGVHMKELQIIDKDIRPIGPICLYKCANIYQPVCGQSPNGVQETFCNPCTMSGESCFRNTTITFVNEGVCKICKLRSPFGPIFLNFQFCGQDADGTLQTFSSVCDLQTLNRCQDKQFQIISLGPCPDCVKCADEFGAVCAKNSAGHVELFQSECHMKYENCIHKNSYVITKAFECGVATIGPVIVGPVLAD